MSKIPWENKVDINNYEEIDRINKWTDEDINETKVAIDDNDDRITELEDQSAENAIGFKTKADAVAAYTAPLDGEPFIIYASTGGSDAGYWFFDSGEVDNVKFDRPFIETSSDINDADQTKAAEMSVVKTLDLKVDTKENADQDVRNMEMINSQASFMEIVDALNRMAIKLDTDGSLDVAKLLIAGVPLTEFVENLNIAIESIITEDDSLEIMDGLNKIAVKLLSDGSLDVAKLLIGGVNLTDFVNALIAASGGGNIESIITDDDSMEIMDGLNRMALKVLNDGSVDMAKLLINGEPFEIKNNLTGKKFASIGDSLAQNGYYEDDFAELTGAIFEKLYAKGGSNSSPNDDGSGQDRLLQLINDVKNETESFDFILLENVNDDWLSIATNLGDIDTEIPFFVSKYEVFDNNFATRDAAEAYWISNFSDVVTPIAEKTKGTIVKLAYDTNSTSIQITSSATATGQIVIQIGSDLYATDVTNGDSPETIAANLEITNYQGYSKSVSGDTMTLVQDEEGAGAISINSNDTGATTSITTATATAYRLRYFMGTTEAEFTVSTNWQDYLSLYSIYKGMIETVQAELPEVDLYWLIPTKWNLIWNPATNGYNPSLFYADGTPNMTAIINQGGSGNGKFFSLVDVVIKICNRYGIKYSDCSSNVGITPFNIEKFYGEANVHPFRIVYTMWAEQMKKDFTYTLKQ